MNESTKNHKLQQVASLQQLLTLANKLKRETEDFLDTVRKELEDAGTKTFYPGDYFETKLGSIAHVRTIDGDKINGTLSMEGGEIS